MKRQKAEVDYSTGHKTSHCGQMSQFDTGYCKHFGSATIQGGVKQGSCDLVAGAIRPGMWCKLWSKAKS